MGAAPTGLKKDNLFPFALAGWIRPRAKTKRSTQLASKDIWPRNTRRRAVQNNGGPSYKGK